MFLPTDNVDFLGPVNPVGKTFDQISKDIDQISKDK
jgi:hypothetical protein